MTETGKELERVADFAPFPWKFVGNSWQYTTIYDANDETLFTLDLEEWGVTEDNQYDLEDRQEALAQFIIKASAALVKQNPTQDELTRQQKHAALLSANAGMKEALERLASPEAFTIARGATEEETARMKFAQAAVDALSQKAEGEVS